MYDFIVIGGGIAGASVADELATQGSVVLVEAEAQAGYHTTGRSAALFAASYGSAAFRALTRLSEPFFQAPPAGFADYPLLRERGLIYIANSAQLGSLGRLLAEIAKSGTALQRLSSEEILRRVPRLRPEAVAAGAFDPGARDIDVEGLLQGFLRRGRTRGVRQIFGARVESAERRGGVWRLRAGSEELQAPVVVNAAGAWADQVAQTFGAQPVGLRVLRRTVALVEPPPGDDVPDWPVIIDVEEQFYFKPDAGKFLISPADEEPAPPGDAHPDELMLAISADRVQQVLDIDIRRISHSWAGLRSFAPDRSPLIGYDAAAPGFFWCAGQGGYGIQSAPAFAVLAARLVCGERLAPAFSAEGVSLAEIDPQRFQSATAPA